MAGVSQCMRPQTWGNTYDAQYTVSLPAQEHSSVQQHKLKH
jgi:hypothetical protein